MLMHSYYHFQSKVSKMGLYFGSLINFNLPIGTYKHIKMHVYDGCRNEL